MWGQRLAGNGVLTRQPEEVLVPHHGLRDGTPRKGRLRTGHLRTGHLRTGHLRSRHLPMGSLRNPHLRNRALPDGALPDGALPRGPLPDGARPLIRTANPSAAADVRALRSPYRFAMEFAPARRAPVQTAAQGARPRKPEVADDRGIR